MVTKLFEARTKLEQNGCVCVKVVAFVDGPLPPPAAALTETAICDQGLPAVHEIDTELAPVWVQAAPPSAEPLLRSQRCVGPVPSVGFRLSEARLSKTISVGAEVIVTVAGEAVPVLLLVALSGVFVATPLNVTAP